MGACRTIHIGTVCLGWLRVEVCQVRGDLQMAVQPENPFVAAQMGNIRNKVGVDRTGVALVGVEGVRNQVVVRPRG